jgi:uncharacterized protein (TIGR03437 family)
MRVIVAAVFALTCASAQEIYNAALNYALVEKPPFAPGTLVRGIFDDQAVLSFRSQADGQTYPAQMLPRTANGSALAIVPTELPIGLADVLVTINGETALLKTITIVPVSIGIFTSSGRLSRQASAQNISDGGTVLNQLTSPALPGQYVTLWATGLGRFTASDVEVSIAGKPVTAAFAGAAPGFPGLNQINFLLPPGVTLGCYVPLKVRVGAVSSNPVTIATAEAPGSCAHPYGLSLDELKALDQGGRVLVNTVRYTSLTAVQPADPLAVETRWEGMLAKFFTHDADGVTVIPAPDENACFVDDSSGYYGSLAPAVESVPIAGPALTLTSPLNHSLKAALADVLWYTPATSAPYGGIYETSIEPAPVASNPAPVWVPGIWQLSSPGGTMISAFAQSYTLPRALHLTNRDSLKSIPRGVDVPVTWDPQGYVSADTVTALLFLGSQPVICRAPASAGKVVFPRDLLFQVPNVLPVESSNPNFLYLWLEPRQPTLFRVPLIAGGTSPGVLNYQFTTYFPVTLQ